MEQLQKISPYQVKISTLRSLHRFNEIIEYVLTTIDSYKFFCQIHQKSPENFGAHWSGYRCFLMDKQNYKKYYLHIGLIYHPQSRTGIMVELDKRSNPEYYQKIWAEIEAGEKYKVNKDEADYLKLFLPREKFALLNNADNAIDQVEILKEYIKAACEAIVEGGK